MDKETKFESSKLKGLTEDEVRESKENFGDNELSQKKVKSILQMFFGAFKDLAVLVLLGALVLKVGTIVINLFMHGNLEASEIAESLGILLALGLSTGISTISEFRNTSRNLETRKLYSMTTSKVIRMINGVSKIVNLPTNDIVTGDIVLVQAGDQIPVDGLVRKGALKVQQAALNGESRDEDKSAVDTYEESETDNFNSKCKVFRGSVVSSGEAYIEATVVGDASELGKINQKLSEEEEENKGAQAEKLEGVVKSINILGITAAILAGVLEIVMTLLGTSQALEVAFIASVVIEAVMFGVSILIMAVPEGLPVMVQLVQFMNSESLYKNHIQVNKSGAFSDSAYMNILFSDKTGTITEGNLSLVEFINGAGNVVQDLNSKEIIDAITLNNEAKIDSTGVPIGSNNMDRALLNYALKHGYKESEDNFNRVKSKEAFNSTEKCSTCTLEGDIVLWKGATEKIIDEITDYVDTNDKLVKFTEDNKKKVLTTMKEQAGRTMKMLTIAKIKKDKKILLAVLCLRDNVRQDAIETVRVLRGAGIETVMVTGDAEDTAIAIAKEAEIYVNEGKDLVLTHEQLEAMTDEEVMEAIPDLRVVSRAKPLDKSRLVELAKKMKNVVGMTGDGVNDSPALKAADVGFAMGDGTAVAKEAGDVVILDNSLKSIMISNLNARTMSKSINKFLIFQLTVNVSTIFMSLLALILGTTLPFSIVQILWINLIMDTLAALAFGGEPVLDRYMTEKPVSREAKILTPYVKSAIASSSVFITVVGLGILKNAFGILDFVASETSDVTTYNKTFMFAFFIYAIIFNSLNTRSEKFNLFEHIGQNKRFIYVMSLIFVLQTVLIYIGGSLFGTVPISLKALFVAMALGVLIIPIDMIRKAIYHKVVKA